jgi:hypothetical protein
MKFAFFSTPLLALVVAGLLTGCDKPQQPPAAQSPQQQVDAADTIYTGGDIVTVNDKQPTADPRQEPAEGRADGDQGHQGRRDDQGRQDDLQGTLIPVGRRPGGSREKAYGSTLADRDVEAHVLADRR